MIMRTLAHKNTAHPAAQVPAPERFLHPTLGPLVAREVRDDYCIDLRTRTECAAFEMRGTSVCPTHFGGPSCQPEHRPDGRPIIWVRDPAYVKGAQ